MSSGSDAGAGVDWQTPGVTVGAAKAGDAAASAESEMPVKSATRPLT